jgi:hypothetical protein
MPSKGKKKRLIKKKPTIKVTSKARVLKADTVRRDALKYMSIRDNAAVFKVKIKKK